MLRAGFVQGVVMIVAESLQDEGVAAQVVEEGFVHWRCNLGREQYILYMYVYNIYIYVHDYVYYMYTCIYIHIYV